MKTATHKSKPIDPLLLADLLAYREASGSISAAQLATRMGVSSTYVSRAFKGTFNGDVDEFEAKARAVLDAHEQKTRAPLVKLATKGFLVAPMRDFLSTVAHTGDIGVAWSDAGMGKTCGIDVYLQRDPLAVRVTSLKHLSGWRALRDAILKEIPQKRRQQHESWDDYLTRIFRGSGRLLVIDNAHLLRESARQWIAYDWHGETGCPVALVGNPDIVAQWSKNDQQQSRVGLAYAIKAKGKAADAARECLALLLPDVPLDETTIELASRIVKGKGSVRALSKHAKLTGELMQSDDWKGKSLSETFKAAHGLLLSNTNLDAAA